MAAHTAVRGKDAADCSWKDVPGRVDSCQKEAWVGTGVGSSTSATVWTWQYQVCMLCVLFPCLLCSEKKIIAFLRSAFLKRFDIKNISFFSREIINS